MQANANPTAVQDVRTVRPREAAALLGVSIPTLYRYAKRPGFPAARKYSVKCTTWTVGELMAWREAQPAVHGA